jgi:hypothetical protein
MVKLNKSPLPEGVVIRTSDDYRNDPVFAILAADCHCKCYICEDKPSSINVEHIIPHKNAPEMKFDWNNLFIACAHCNSIKGTKFNNIINPIARDPEVYIALSVELNDDFVETIRVLSLEDDEQTLQTAKLLEFVYSGGFTTMKDVESANLRNEQLLPDIQRFKKFVQGHEEEPELGYDVLIKKDICRSAKFSAFKRKIIRDNPNLAIQFADVLA